MKISYLLLFLIIPLLLVSLALNYYFYKKSFIPSHAIRLDPIGLSFYPSTAGGEQPGSDKPSFMYYGDSRALSWPYVADERYEFINRAIGNQTSIQISERFEAHVAPHKPDVLLVQMCVNDLKMIPLFPEQKQSIIDNCKSNIEDIISKARNINSKIVLSTVFPLGDVSIARKALGIKEQPIIEGIDEVNQHIKAQASDDIAIFDSFELLVGDDQKVDARYSSDWLHLSAEGYKLLNQHLLKLMKNVSF